LAGLPLVDGEMGACKREPSCVTVRNLNAKLKVQLNKGEMEIIKVSPKTLAAAILVLVVSGCSKSNPLIGKWKLAANSPPMCQMMDGVEFTEKTMTLNVLGKQMATVTYSRDGDRYLVTAPNGTMAFEKNSDGIKSVTPFDCQLIPAS
jgi:hypothetical protein